MSSGRLNIHTEEQITEIDKILEEDKQEEGSDTTGYKDFLEICRK